MEIETKQTLFSEIEPLRNLYRQEMNCQIVRDSILPRGLAEPYLITIGKHTAGYGGVWNSYDRDRIMEFYVLPHYRTASVAMFKSLIAESGATSAEAQTNSPLMLMMLFDCCQNIGSDTILFADAFISNHSCNGAVMVRTDDLDPASVFEHKHEPKGDWALELDGNVVATGGALLHYNPPYADLYMEVDENYRRQGFGSYLVQELKRKCYAMGKIPAARCNAENTASRRTLEKAGLLPCARIVVGDITTSLIQGA